MYRRFLSPPPLLSSMAVVLLAALPSAASTLFTTGTTDIEDGPSASVIAWVFAAPFTLTSQATIQSASIWADLFDSWDGTMDYYLFDNNGLYPGSTPLAQGTGTDVVKTLDTCYFVGSTCVLPVYEVDFDLASPVTLDPGTYWFGIHMQDNFSSGSEAAVWAALPGDPGNRLDAGSPGGTFDNWVLGAEDNAFTLNGSLGSPVPEPGYMPLFLLAALCIAVGVVRRNRRARFTPLAASAPSCSEAVLKLRAVSSPQYRAVCGLVFFFCLVSLPSKADVIYSDFGSPGNLYLTDNLSAWPVGLVTLGNTGNHELVSAIQFTIPTGVWQVNQVDVAVRNVTAPADAVFIIAVDNGGVPGSYFWSQPVSNIPAEDSTCCQLTTVNISSGFPILNSNTSTTYWLIVGSGATGNSDIWPASPGASGTWAEMEDNGDWFTGGTTNPGAFDILGANLVAPPTPAVPEPANWVLLGGGFALLALVRLRARRRLVQSDAHKSSDIVQHGRRSRGRRFAKCRYSRRYS